MNKSFQSEPATIISVIVAFVTALIGLLAVFGLDISDDQRNAIIGVIGPAVLVIAAVGPIIRQFVFSPKSADKLVTEAYEAGKPPTEPKPDLPEPPGNV